MRGGAGGDEGEGDEVRVSKGKVEKEGDRIDGIESDVRARRG